MESELKADLDKYLKEHLDPINKKMIEQERVKYEAFLEKHFDKYDKLEERHSSYISQLITLEGVIFGAVVIFTNAQNISVWLITSVCLILISLIFGIWRQNINIQASYQSHQADYDQRLKSHWWARELWKDETVKTEKEMFQSNLEGEDSSYKKKFSYKLMVALWLNADRIENIFIISFIISLALLIVHIISKIPGVA